MLDQKRGHVYVARNISEPPVAAQECQLLITPKKPERKTTRHKPLYDGPFCAVIYHHCYQHGSNVATISRAPSKTQSLTHAHHLNAAGQALLKTGTAAMAVASAQAPASAIRKPPPCCQSCCCCASGTTQNAPATAAAAALNFTC